MIRIKNRPAKGGGFDTLSPQQIDKYAAEMRRIYDMLEEQRKTASPDRLCKVRAELRAMRETIRVLRGWRSSPLERPCLSAHVRIPNDRPFDRRFRGYWGPIPGGYREPLTILDVAIEVLELESSHYESLISVCFRRPRRRQFLGYAANHLRNVFKAESGRFRMDLVGEMLTKHFPELVPLDKTNGGRDLRLWATGLEKRFRQPRKTNKTNLRKSKKG